MSINPRPSPYNSHGSAAKNLEQKFEPFSLLSLLFLIVRGMKQDPQSKGGYDNKKQQIL